MNDKNAHQRFTELNVWKQTRVFKLAVYKIIEQFPNEEKYNLRIR
jgi:23S rRNA-intervening sequence protein